MGRVLQAAKSGDKRKLLEETRDSLAYAIDTCDSKRDLAALTKRLLEVCDMIAALPDPNGEQNPIDEMADLINGYEDEYDDA